MFKRSSLINVLPTTEFAGINRLNGLQNYVFPLLAGFVSLLVYSITLAPDLTWANFGSDGGELITASITWGIPHPPGYPTYIILGKLFSLLPFGTLAWRFNLFSAVAAATAITFVTATSLDMLSTSNNRYLASMSAGIAMAFTPMLWSQAIITEVYALNIAVIAIFLWSLLKRRSALQTGLFAGLSITTHLTSLMVLPMAFALTPRKHWKRLLAGAAIGLSPLLILPILGRSVSPVIWGNPSTPSGWWWLVSGQIYHANLVVSPISTLLPKISQLSVTMLRQLVWVGWLFVVLGIASRLIERRVLSWLLITSLAYLSYNFFYVPDDAIVTVLPIFILLGPALAAGLSQIGFWSFFLPLALLIANYQTLDLHENRSLRPMAYQIFDAAPQNAILLTPGDQSIFTLWYFYYGEAYRQDLALVDTNLFAFEWYRHRLSNSYPDLLAVEEDNVDAFIKSNGRSRPICFVPPNLDGDLDCYPKNEI